MGGKLGTLLVYSQISPRQVESHSERDVATPKHGVLSLVGVLPVVESTPEKLQEGEVKVLVYACKNVERLKRHILASE